jgi:hypothetical protein
MRWLFLFVIGFFFIGCNGTNSSDEVNFDSEVKYEVIVDANWTNTNFATNFPSNAHFSPFVWSTHDIENIIFQNGYLANNGVKQVAETGATSVLVSLLNESNNSKFHTVAGGIGSGDGTITFTVSANQSHPYLSLISMIAPSPDWFVGLNSLNLFENGEWLENKTIELSVYDSGTDSGVNFTSSNSVTEPREVIIKLTTDSQNTDFMDGKHRESLKSLVQISITKK